MPVIWTIRKEGAIPPQKGAPMVKQVRLLTDVERDVLLFLRSRGDEGAGLADIVNEGVTPFTGIAGDALKALKRDKLVEVRDDPIWRVTVAAKPKR
jgi:hypothetical protein